MTKSTRCLAAALSLALAASAAPAWAQAPAPPANDTVATARAHFARGVKLYEEDDYRAALIEFNRAYELAPNWAVLYDVGQSYYQLREYANALRTLEKYVREGGAQIPADRRPQVDREIAELRGRVAHVTIASNAEGAEVTLDDVSLGRSPLPDRVLIGAGRHKIGATKAGYLPASKVVDIAGGDVVTIEIDLTEERSATATPTEPPTYVPAAVFTGVGVAGIVVGTVFGISAINDKSSLDKNCSAQKLCPASSQSDVDAYGRNGAISTVGFGVGVVGLVFAAYFYLHARAGEQGDAPPSQARTTPWIGPGPLGLSGTF